MEDMKILKDTSITSLLLNTNHVHDNFLQKRLEQATSEVDKEIISLMVRIHEATKEACVSSVGGESSDNDDNLTERLREIWSCMDLYGGVEGKNEGDEGLPSIPRSTMKVRSMESIVICHDGDNTKNIEASCGVMTVPPALGLSSIVGTMSICLTDSIAPYEGAFVG